MLLLSFFFEDGRALADDMGIHDGNVVGSNSCFGCNCNLCFFVGSGFGLLVLVAVSPSR